MLAELFVLGRGALEKGDPADVHLGATVLLEQKRGIGGAELRRRARSARGSLAEDVADL
jgi:hypothetical protein